MSGSKGSKVALKNNFTKEGRGGNKVFHVISCRGEGWYGVGEIPFSVSFPSNRVVVCPRQPSKDEDVSLISGCL